MLPGEPRVIREVRAELDKKVNRLPKKLRVDSLFNCAAHSENADTNRCISFNSSPAHEPAP